MKTIALDIHSPHTEPIQNLLYDNCKVSVFIQHGTQAVKFTRAL